MQTEIDKGGRVCMLYVVSRILMFKKSHTHKSRVLFTEFSSHDYIYIYKALCTRDLTCLYKRRESSNWSLRAEFSLLHLQRALDKVRLFRRVVFLWFNNFPFCLCQESYGKQSIKSWLTATQ